MPISAEKVRKMYSGMSARHYDLPISHFFAGFKEAAFRESSLNPGGTALVLCCGTGLDFPYILQKIGPTGHIVGVDFSPQMLAQARKKVKKRKWENVELIEADATTFKDPQGRTFDAGVCTLGMSIIPDYRAAYGALLSHAKPGGEVIIGDMQLASGWLARFNPVTVLLGKRYGATKEGHQNTLDLYESMKSDLENVRKRVFFFGAYFYAIGRKSRDG